MLLRASSFELRALSFPRKCGLKPQLSYLEMMIENEAQMRFWFRNSKLETRNSKLNPCS